MVLRYVLCSCDLDSWGLVFGPGFEFYEYGHELPDSVKEVQLARLQAFAECLRSYGVIFSVW
jgi:hypothetical protein